MSFADVKRHLLDLDTIAPVASSQSALVITERHQQFRGRTKTGTTVPGFASSGKGKNKPKQQSLSAQECSWCNSKGYKSFGHTWHNCQKLKDFKKNHDQTSRHDKAEAHVATGNDDKVNNRSFYLDTCATSHMCPNPDRFESLSIYRGPLSTVTSASGDEMPIEGKGNVIVNCLLSNGSVSTCRLTDVLYVPQIGRSLVSYRQIMHKGYSLQGDKNILRLVKDGRTWLEAIFDGTLPRIKEVSHSAFLTFEQWHHALGHAAPTAMAKTKDLVSISKGLPSCPSNFHCHQCTIAKSTQSKPKSATSRSSTPGEYIHSDLCGPFPEASYGGTLYYICFICDYSRYAWVRFLKQKSDAAQAIEDFVNQIETQLSTRVKRFRTDNGGEYLNQKVHGYFAQKGIEHDCVPPYSHESNGVAERLNRSIGDGIRAMLLSLPTYDRKLWAEAVNTYVYVKNRQTHSSVQGQTPYEAFYGKKPSIDHLQPFGREVYVHVPREKRIQGMKLQPRAELGLFVGYTKVTHHYRVFIPSSKRTIVSGQVMFPPPLIKVEQLPEQVLAHDYSSTSGTSVDIPHHAEGYPNNDAWFNHLNHDPEYTMYYFKKGSPLVQNVLRRAYHQGHRSGILGPELRTKYQDLDNWIRLNLEQTNSNLQQTSLHSTNELSENAVLSQLERRGDYNFGPISRHTKTGTSVPDSASLENSNLESISSSTKNGTEVPVFASSRNCNFEPQSVPTDTSTAPTAQMPPPPTRNNFQIVIPQRPVPDLDTTMHDAPALPSLDTTMHDAPALPSSDYVTRAGRKVHPPTGQSRPAWLTQHRPPPSDGEIEESLVSVLSIYEPKTYKQAIESPHSTDWQKAMDDEINSLKENDVWIVVPRPRDQKVVGGRWVYKAKGNELGELERFKARYVAQGFSQTQGLDFDEIFAPVARYDSLRLLLAIAAHFKWKPRQLDIKTAFLYGLLKEEVYMELPEGSRVDGHVAKLNRCIYGLKQSPREWFFRLVEFLAPYGFASSTFDPCVLIHNSGDLFIAVYVDDLSLFGKPGQLLNQTVDLLKTEFKVNDMGDLHWLLGLQIEYSEAGISLSQTAYIDKTLTKFAMQDCNPVSTPLDQNTNLSKSTEGETRANATLYQSIIGSLMYLVTGTRPDLVFTVTFLSQFNSDPSTSHLNAAKRVLRYIKGTREKKLLYAYGSPLALAGFADASYANCLDTRRSFSGYIFQLGSSTIAWRARKQRSVATSTCEAEYMAMALATKQHVWLHRALTTLLKTDVPAILSSDSKAALDLAHNAKLNDASKHIDVAYHFVRERVEDGSLILLHVTSQENLADICTKGLPRPTHEHLCISIYGQNAK